jgi:hypothetical protein
MARDVFISYKTEDREAAERLCAALERENISCWMAPRDIPPGQEWAASIVAGLQRSRSFVLLLSSHSTTARQIAREAELADKQNLPIITFRLEDVQPPNELLYFLGNLQWVDGFGGQFDSAATRLAGVIRNSPNYPAPESTIGVPPRPAAPAPPPVTPTKRNVWPIAAGLLVLLALVAWLVLRRSTPVVDTLQEAKTVGDRFLNERDNGNYDAAWNEYTASFHDRENRNVWQRDLEKRAAKTIHSSCFRALRSAAMSRAAAARS